MKKKVLFITLSLVLLLSLCACSTPSPTEVTNEFLQAVKEQDNETISTLYAEGSLDLSEEVKNESDMDDYDQMFNEQIVPKLLEFDYEVGNEKIDGDKATVEAKITAYNLGDAFTKFIGEYLTQAFGLALSGASDEKMEEIAIKIFSEVARDMEKNFESTVTINLSQKDGNWVIDKIEDDDPLLNAITGGLIEAAADLEDSFNTEE